MLYLKEALVCLLLKKPTLDSIILDNFCPISNIHFWGRWLTRYWVTTSEESWRKWIICASFSIRIQTRAWHGSGIGDTFGWSLTRVEWGCASLFVLLDLLAAFPLTMVSFPSAQSIEGGYHVAGFAGSLPFSRVESSQWWLRRRGPPSAFTRWVATGFLLSTFLFNIYMGPLSELIHCHGVRY